MCCIPVPSPDVAVVIPSVEDWGGKGRTLPIPPHILPGARRTDIEGGVVPQGVRSKKFIEEGWFHDFGQGLSLTGGRCPSCGHTCFPAKRVCPSCFNAEQRKVPLGRKGKLHTFARSHMGPSGIEAPFTIGFIDLPEGMKLFSLLTQCEPWDQVLKVGMEMEMVIETIREDEEGNEIVGYKFRPSGGGGS